MTSSRRLRFTDQARRDLRTVVRYTARTWGEDQAQTYTERLMTTVDRLAWYPDLGRPRDDLRRGVRIHPVGEHVVYYLVDDTTVTIVRVLHGRMDAVGKVEP